MNREYLNIQDLVSHPKKNKSLKKVLWYLAKKYNKDMNGVIYYKVIIIW